MEEVINKPDNQFKDILNDLVDYTKDSEEKSALIEEVCRSKHSAKPAASLNSSIYSSAASSSSSSTSSASDSSTNSASSSSTSSTLSSPSQSSQTNVESNNKNRSNQLLDNDFDKLEVAKMEDLGKTARILEHRIAHSAHRSAANVNGIIAVSLHSDRRSSNNNTLQNNAPRTSASLTSQLPSHKITLQQQNQLKTNPTQHNISDSANFMINGANNTTDTTNTVSSWKTISGKRDKRRKKPAEQPVLSQHIPGHKGEHEVDWLVNYIESGAGATNNNNNSINKKNNKSAKVQSKRPLSQTTESNHHRDSQQRKSNNINSSTANTNTKSTTTQARSQTLSRHSSSSSSSSSEDSDDAMSDTQSSIEKRVFLARPSNQSQSVKQQQQQPQQPQQQQQQQQQQEQKQKQQQPLTQARANERKDDEIKSTNQKPAAAPASRRNHEPKPTDEPKPSEAAVTFADHIRLSDGDDSLGERYTFGFFEEQPKKEAAANQVKTVKPIPQHNEVSNVSSSSNNNNSNNNNNNNNNKSSHISQKHKTKHLKASLNSEQKRYKCNDSVDATSFNYHQILAFVSNSWETTAKSHRLMVKNNGA